MDVIDMAFEIGVIANSMLPVAPCQMPFSRLAVLPRDLGRASRPREKPLLIKLQRVESRRHPQAEPKPREDDRVGRKSRPFRTDGLLRG